MIKANVIRVCLLIFVFIEFSFSEIDENKFKIKFCDKNLSDSKISAVESCEQYVPKEAQDDDVICLKKLNQGTTFKDLRKTYCDQTLGPKYMDCLKDLLNQKKKEGKDIKEEDLQKYNDCFKKELEL